MCRAEVIEEARRKSYYAMADMLQLLRDICEWSMNSLQLRTIEDFAQRKSQFNAIRSRFIDFQNKSIEKVKEVSTSFLTR